METKVKTLLEIAKDVPINHRKKADVTQEEFELAIAYLKGEVSNKQVGAAIGEPSGVSMFLSRCLIAGFRKGWVVEKNLNS